MPVSLEQRRAICRVYVPDADRIGTGFLIKPRLVMTAAHVVCARDDAQQPYGAKDIELRFGDGPRVKVTGVAVAAGSFHPEVDWAVLQTPADVADVDPIPLRPYSPGYQVPWSTVGYPKDDDVRGTDYEGQIVTDNPDRMQLWSRQINDLPSGISGAPCIVDGHAIAVIVRSKRETSTETLYAVGMTAIDHAAVVRTEAPYVDEVKRRLPPDDDLLDHAAQELGFPGTKATIASERKPSFVAEAMMRSGMRMDCLRITEAIGHLTDSDQFKKGKALEIVRFAARAWIDALAVARLHEVLVGGHQIAIVNAWPSELGSWYVQRASCVGRPHPGRFRHCQNVDAVSMSDPGEVRKRIEDAIERLADHSPFVLAEFLARHPHNTDPIVLVLQGVPARKVFDRVRAGLDPVRFVLLSGPALVPAIRADYPDAAIILPELEASVADRAISQFHDAMWRVGKKFVNPQGEP